MNTWVQAFITLGYIPRSGIVVSYGNPMTNFLRNCQPVFQGCCTIFHSHQRYTGFRSVDTFILADTCYEVSFSITIVMSVKWYFIVVLICTSLMMSVLMNIHPLLIFKWVVFLSMSIQSYLYIPDTSLLSDTWYANILCHCVDSFYFLVVCFEAEKFSVLMRSNLCIFSFLAYALPSYLRINCQIRCQKTTPMFSLKI